MEETKYYDTTYIWKEYEKMSAVKKVAVLWSALDYMEEYNGRSKTTCLAMAMGYKNIEGDSFSYFKD